jgi:hypothetical protein
MNRFAGQVAVTLIDRTARINLRKTREVREEEQPILLESKSLKRRGSSSPSVKACALLKVLSPNMWAPSAGLRDSRRK